MSTGLPQLTLYRREGCHLCEDMEQQLAELLEPGSHSLERVDIDEDETLRDQFNVRVPVLFLGELELCEHFLDLEAVRLALAGYNS
ncbi:MAG: glutaredoxin family protein [Granulosicoccus sp.]